MRTEVMPVSSTNGVSPLAVDDRTAMVVAPAASRMVSATSEGARSPPRRTSIGTLRTTWSCSGNQFKAPSPWAASCSLSVLLVTAGRKGAWRAGSVPSSAKPARDTIAGSEAPCRPIKPSTTGLPEMACASR